MHFLNAQCWFPPRSEQRCEKKRRWLPAACEFTLINVFVFLAKFPFRVSLKRACNGESVVRSGNTKCENVRALTVLGNQVEILSDCREPSGGNHFRKERTQLQGSANDCSNRTTGGAQERAYVYAQTVAHLEYSYPFLTWILENICVRYRSNR